MHQKLSKSVDVQRNYNRLIKTEAFLLGTTKFNKF